MKICKAILVLVGLIGAAAFAQARAQHTAKSEEEPVLRSVATALRFSRDSQRMISAGVFSDSGVSRDILNRTYESGDNHLRVWDVNTGQQTWRLPTSPINSNWGSNGGSVLLMPNFKTMLTTWGAWEVKPVDIHSFHIGKYIQVDNGNIGSVTLSPNEKILAIGMTGAVEFRDAKTYKIIRTFRHGGQGTEVHFGPDSSTAMCTWGGNSKPQAIDVSTGKQIHYPRWFYRVEKSDAYAFSPDGERIALARSQNIEVWTTPHENAGKKLQTLAVRLNRVRVLQFSPDGKTLAVGGESSTTTPVQFFKL